jgi:tRNA threonylcarbamoyladenosine biosynthesis protein TsaB
MIVLGVETATGVGSVAIVNEEGVIGECTLNVSLNHSERLLPIIDQLLKNSDVSFPRIDGLVVSLGPGSFTGLRIGISTIKGLSLASEKPVVGISTLDGLAHHYPCAETLVCPMLDARKNEVFAALYRWNASFELQKITTDLAIAPQKLLQKINERVMFLGDGSLVYESLIKELLGSKALFAPPHLRHPRAATIACLGLEELKKGNTLAINNVTPLYIRPSDAERNKKT